MRRATLTKGMQRATFAAQAKPIAQSGPQRVLVERTAKVYKKHAVFSVLSIVAGIVVWSLAASIRGGGFFANVLGALGFLLTFGGIAYYLIIKCFRWWDHE